MNAPIKRKAPVKKFKKRPNLKNFLTTRTRKEKKWPRQLLGKKISKREAQLRKCLQQPILLFFRVTPVTFWSEDSAQALTTSKDTEGDLPTPGPAMITQNPGTQESVSCTLNFGQDAAVAPIPITNEQVEENSELVAGVQVADDVQVEGAVLEEVVGEQVDEQEFVKDAVLEEGSEMWGNWSAPTSHYHQRKVNSTITCSMQSPMENE
jgi:hypothetical protein